MNYAGMQVDILELFVEARQCICPRRGRSSAIDPREATRFATITRSARRSLDDRRIRRGRASVQAGTEAQAALSEDRFRAAYASTFTAGQARLRGPRGGD
jgi:hypothetical protein